MLLATVTNDKYFFNAVNLIDSYKVNSFNKQIMFYALDLNDKYREYLKKRYGSQVIIEEIPKACDHAHSLTTFFYKASAIRSAMQKDHDFIYSDATNEFVKFTTDLKRDLKRRSGRIILPYGHEMLKNKYWTTKSCFKRMECTETRFKEAPQHWAGLQIYSANEENKNLVEEVYQYMLDIEIAGPQVGIKYGMVEDFDVDLAHKYGDQQTLMDFNQSYRPRIEEVVIFSRKTKFNDYSKMRELC